MNANDTLPAIVVKSNVILPDNDCWTNRFNIKSSSSNRIYTIAQNKKKRHWACDCPGYKRNRKCKHLLALALPTNEIPYEMKLEISI